MDLLVGHPFFFVCQVCGVFNCGKKSHKVRRRDLSSFLANAQSKAISCDSQEGAPGLSTQADDNRRRWEMGRAPIPGSCTTWLKDASPPLCPCILVVAELTFTCISGTPSNCYWRAAVSG